MSGSTSTPETQRSRMFSLACGIMALATALGVWVALHDEKKPEASRETETYTGRGQSLPKVGHVGSEVVSDIVRNRVGDGEEFNDVPNSDGQNRNEARIANNKQPQLIPGRVAEHAAVLALLASGKQTVDERVRQMRGLRGKSFAKEDRERALAFLAGKDWPEGMGKGSMHWLADELLTALRLQDPPWDGMAAQLGEVAFQAATDPVVRDYLMQHLGHLWEQYGARKEIDQSLWRAVGTSEPTTPGTALIALSRGYGRDRQQQSLESVQQRAFELARNPATPLAVRVTALSIAGESGNKDVKDLAQNLAQAKETPVILRKVAERVVR